MLRRDLVGAAAVSAILLACLAGCAPQATQQSPDDPTITPTSVNGPEVVLNYNDCPPVFNPVASGPGAYDGADGFDTVQKGPLALDQSGCSSNVTNLDVAENWTFEGTTDQNIEIRVLAYGGADPQLVVIDPNGDVIDTSDDIGNTRSQVADEQLPLDGVYTLRVTMFAQGIYTINVQTGRPPS